jgi:hypothetical protein
MLTDAQLRDAAETMMRSGSIPAVPIEAIRSRIIRKTSSPKEIVRPRRRLALVAAILLIAVPAIAYSAASYYTRSRAALQSHGGWAPPPPPAGFRLNVHRVTLAQARSAARFALIPPRGLPAGTMLLKIYMGPIGLYDRTARKWIIGPDENVFRYRRTDGRIFDVIVEPYDRRIIPGRYVFEDRGPDAKGNPILVRHENIAWVNGNQVTFVSDGEALDMQGALAMMNRMGGKRLNLPWPELHSHGTLRVIP